MAGQKPSPERENNRDFVTPLVEDTLFFQMVNISRVCPPGVDPPAYGTAHPNTAVFPGYRLSYIKNVTPDGDWQQWFYAKNREDQNTYSYRIDYPYSGNVRYPRITRWFITLREDSIVPLPLGTPDTGDQAIITYQIIQPEPATVDDGAILQPSPSTFGIFSPLQTTSPAVLVGQSVEPIPVESGIGSLWVKVTQFFDVIPGSDDAVPGSGSSQTESNYKVTRPMGTAAFFRLEWKLTLPRTVADLNRTPDYQACPIAGYENLLLVDETITASSENNQSSDVVRVYSGNISGLPFPSVEFVTYHGKFYPGQMPPDKFIVSKEKYVQTYITDASSDVDVTTPSVPPISTPPPRYGAMESVEAKPDGLSALEGTKSVTFYTEVTVATLSGEQWDNRLRDIVDYTVFVIPSDEAANIGAPEPGTEREITPLSTGWSMVTIQAPRETTLEVVPNFIVSGQTPRSYLDSDVDIWPNVLSSLGIGVTPNGDQLYLQWKFNPKAYNGPTTVLREVAWSKTQWLINVVPGLTTQSLQTSSISIRWPGVLMDSIPACLHYNPNDIPDLPAGTFLFTLPGTTYYETWEPTFFATWPDYYIKDIKVEPYLGGWRIERVTYQKPNLT